MISACRQSLSLILSEVENARSDLCEHVRTDETEFHDLVTFIAGATNVLESMDQGLDQVGERLRQMSSGLSDETKKRSLFESMMWKQQQDACELQRMLRATNAAASDVSQECHSLALISQALWDENRAIHAQVGASSKRILKVVVISGLVWQVEDQCKSSEAECSELRVKLQSAWQEGLKLLDTVQRQESENAGLMKQLEEVQAHLDAQEAAAVSASATLISVQVAADILEQFMATFQIETERLRYDVCSSEDARRHLEQLLLSERIRIGELERSLLESSQTARDAAAECAEFSTQVRLLWEEKVGLERQVTVADLFAAICF